MSVVQLKRKEMADDSRFEEIQEILGGKQIKCSFKNQDGDWRAIPDDSFKKMEEVIPELIRAASNSPSKTVQAKLNKLEEGNKKVKLLLNQLKEMGEAFTSQVKLEIEVKINKRLGLNNKRFYKDARVENGILEPYNSLRMKVTHEVLQALITMEEQFSLRFMGLAIQCWESHLEEGLILNYNSCFQDFTEMKVKINDEIMTYLGQALKDCLSKNIASYIWRLMESYPEVRRQIFTSNLVIETKPLPLKWRGSNNDKYTMQVPYRVPCKTFKIIDHSNQIEVCNTEPKLKKGMLFDDVTNKYLEEKKVEGLMSAVLQACESPEWL